MLKIFRLLRLAKLLRLARIKRLLNRLEERYTYLTKGSRLGKIIVCILGTAHFVACLWHYAGSSDHQKIGIDRETGDTVQVEPWVVLMYGGIGKSGMPLTQDAEGVQVSKNDEFCNDEELCIKNKGFCI